MTWVHSFWCLCSSTLEFLHRNSQKKWQQQKLQWRLVRFSYQQAPTIDYSNSSLIDSNLNNEELLGYGSCRFVLSTSCRDFLRYSGSFLCWDHFEGWVLQRKWSTVVLWYRIRTTFPQSVPVYPVGHRHWRQFFTSWTPLFRHETVTPLQFDSERDSHLSQDIFFIPKQL